MCDGLVLCRAGRGLPGWNAYSHRFPEMSGVGSGEVGIQPLGWDLHVKVEGGVLLGGVTGPRGDVWTGVAGIMGGGLRGGGVK